MNIPARRLLVFFLAHLKFMANPWSPPAWMKNNGSLLGVSNGVTGMLNSGDYEPLARYFVKSIQAYQAEDLPLYAITSQNEPLCACNFEVEWQTAEHLVDEHDTIIQVVSVGRKIYLLCNCGYRLHRLSGIMLVVEKDE